MRLQLRIVAGSLRGRKVSVPSGPHLRPTPQMVREALFSILGDAVPGRPFYDVFAGTGVVGLEAVSRGARAVTFVERDFRLADAIAHHIQAFGVIGAARVVRADVYRWGEHWQAPDEPVTLFLSPPFADFERRSEEMMLLTALEGRAAVGSVLVLQGETGAEAVLPTGTNWEERRYGRNVLFIRVKGE